MPANFSQVGNGKRKLSWSWTEKIKESSRSWKESFLAGGRQKNHSRHSLTAGGPTNGGLRRGLSVCLFVRGVTLVIRRGDSQNVTFFHDKMIKIPLQIPQIFGSNGHLWTAGITKPFKNRFRMAKLTANATKMRIEDSKPIDWGPKARTGYHRSRWNDA